MKKIFISLFLLISLSQIHATVTSGFFVILMSGDSIRVDFSGLKDTGLLTSTSTVSSADIAFPVLGSPQYKIVSFRGIIDAGVIDSSTFVKLDSVPAEGYSVALQPTPTIHHLYEIKTSEGNFAAFFCSYQFIGGVDRFGFDWKYQSDGTNKFNSTFIKPYYSNMRFSQDFLGITHHTIRYRINSCNLISLSVHDVKGRLVTRLVDGKQIQGEYRREIPPDLVPGSYVVSLHVGNDVKLSKVFVK